VYRVNNINMKAKKHNFNLRENEKNQILNCLEYTQGNMRRTAELLGISRVSLYMRLEKFKINQNKYRVN